MAKTLEQIFSGQQEKTESTKKKSLEQIFGSTESQEPQRKSLESIFGVGKVEEPKVPVAEQAAGLIGRLKGNLEEKFEAGKIGGTEEEKIQRAKKQIVEKGREDLKTTGKKFQELARETPKIIATEVVRPFVSFVRGIQGLVPGGKTGKEPVNVPFLGDVKPISETTVGEKIQGAATLAGAKLPLAKSIGKAKQLGKLEDVISPGLTKKTQQLASKEGRIVRGKESKLFGKKPDKVLVDKKVNQSAKTIQKRIPDFNNLDDQVLNTRVQTEIGNIAKVLKPSFKTVNVSPKQTTKVKDAWTKLKKKQSGDPDLNTIPGFKQIQSKFDTFLKEVNKPVRGTDGKFRPKDLDDIWQIRKEYDKSIKPLIKQADSLSDSSSQFKKDMWLDNRRLLNDLLDEMSTGLEKTSKQAFDEMADLYRARQNIIGKTKVDIKGKPGLLSGSTLLKGGAGLVGAGVATKLLID